MKARFVCSLCRHGVLGGGLVLDENTIQFKTGKVTVEKRFRNFTINRNDISSISWKWIVFPMATFETKNGDKNSFLIFNKWRFMKIYTQ